MVMQLIKATEKRTERRHACEAMIKWTQFNRIAFHYGHEIYYHARVLNFSKSGLYFETTDSLKPGTILLFRLEASRCGASDSEDYECLRTISLVEIKWCQDLHQNGESYFGIGARYPIFY